MIFRGIATALVTFFTNHSYETPTINDCQTLRNDECPFILFELTVYSLHLQLLIIFPPVRVAPAKIFKSLTNNFCIEIKGKIRCYKFISMIAHFLKCATDKNFINQ